VFSVGIGTNVTPGADVTDITRLANGTVNALSIIGNNPHLKPETGKNWQIGADFTPSFVPGLKLSATYYNISYRNKLGVAGVPLPIFVPGPLGSAALETLYRPYVIPIHNTNVTASGCTLDPALQQFVGFLYSANVNFNPRDYCNVNVVIDSRTLSAANTFQDGLDINLSYFKTTGIGTFLFNLGASKIFTDTQRTVAGAPMISVLDTIGNPISWRGRGNVTWTNGPVSASLFGNYVGPYTNNQPISIQGVVQPIVRIPSWTTFDLNIAYSFDRHDARWALMRGVRIGLSVNNLFGNEPPIVESALSGSSSIDLFAHNANGRTMQFQVTKAF
jgi:iron complex outermembrane receptor protein